MTVCTKCLLDKPQESFFWERRRNRYTTACKACRNAAVVAWAKKNRARANETVHRAYAKKIGKHPDECRGKKYTPEEWKARERARAKRKYDSNKGWYLAYFQDRYRKNKKRIRAINDRWRSKNPDKVKAAARRRYRANPAQAVANLATRKARKMRAQPLWLTAVQKAQIREMYDVAKAKSMQTGIRHDVDHIFPLVNGEFCGLHVPWNLQVLSEGENRKKSTYFPIEFSHMRFDEMR